MKEDEDGISKLHEKTEASDTEHPSIKHPSSNLIRKLIRASITIMKRKGIELG